MNARRAGLLKSGAAVVNTARLQVIDQEAIPRAAAAQSYRVDSTPYHHHEVTPERYGILA